MNPVRETLAALFLTSAMTTSWAAEYAAVIDTSSTKSMDVAPLGIDAGAFGYESTDETVRGLEKDLNGDGVDELILQGSIVLCGTGGCTYHIVDGKSRKKIGAIFGSPLVVHVAKINGWPVISVYSHSSATSGSYSTFVYDGSQYAQASSVMLHESSVVELFRKLRGQTEKK